VLIVDDESRPAHLRDWLDEAKLGVEVLTQVVCIAHHLEPARHQMVKRIEVDVLAEAITLLWSALFSTHLIRRIPVQGSS